MNVCTWSAPLVKLADGRQVPSDSEEWREECEARHVINMPTIAARRAFLRGTLDERGNISGGVLRKRGEAATVRLENTIKRLWYSAPPAE